MPKTHTPYPWSSLYNLESGRGQRPLPLMTRRGRPRSPVPRERIDLYLTEEEKKMLGRSLRVIQGQFDTDKISRGQVVGVALRLLEHQIKQRPFPKELADWEQLAAYLFDEA